MIQDSLKKLIIFIVAVAVFAPVRAVTDKEMEEAKAITAQCYLRYANDGSGYLDEFNANSMSELEAKLKTQEKENLKAFNNVKIPSDYASWDKARLVEFWAVTFFNSPGLAEKGKGAKKRVRNRIEKMEIGKAAAKEPETVKPAETSEQPSASPAVTPVPSAETAIAEQDSLLAEQLSVEEEMESEPVVKKKSSNTWVYLLILGVLVAAVIALVVFAAKTMKRSDQRLSALKPQPEEEKQPVKKGGEFFEEEEKREMYEKYSATLNEKNQEIRSLRDDVQSLQSENKKLRNENDRLKSENGKLNGELLQLRGNVAARAGDAVAVVPEQPKAKPKDDILHLIYLGKVNSEGAFVRGDRKVIPGVTIYRLDTEDGFVGTFRVIRNEALEADVLMNAEELLGNGCVAKDLSATEGKSRIVTETPGTAIFEKDRWKVLRKAKIRYE